MKAVLIHKRKSPDVKESKLHVYGVRLRNRWDTPCHVLCLRLERPQKMTDGEHVDASRWTKYKVGEGWNLNTRLDFSHKIQWKKMFTYRNPSTRAGMSVHVLLERYQVVRGHRLQSN